MVQQSIKGFFPLSGESTEPSWLSNEPKAVNSSLSFPDPSEDTAKTHVDLPARKPGIISKRVTKAIKKQVKKRLNAHSKCKRDVVNPGANARNIKRGARSTKPVARLNADAVPFSPPDGTTNGNVDASTAEGDHASTPVASGDLVVSPDTTTLSHNTPTADDASLPQEMPSSDNRNISDMLSSALSDTANVSLGFDTIDPDELFSIESQFVALCVENDSVKQENASLNVAVQLLTEEISDYRKVSNAQKQEIKRAKSENDDLRRELSRSKGIRKHIEDTEMHDVHDKTKAELSAAQSKLVNMKESLVNIANSVLDVVENSGDNNLVFTEVKHRRKSPTSVNPEDIITIIDGPVPKSVIAQCIPVVVDRFPAVPRFPVQPEVTSTHTFAEAVARGKIQSTTTESHRRNSPVIIGTSITRGVGEQLNDRGVPAECYMYRGCQIPHIKSRVKHIIPGHVNPRLCVLQAGGNDAERESAAAVISQYDGLIQEVRRCSPGSDIIVSAIPHRRKNLTINNKIDQINAHLQQKCTQEEGIHYIRVCPDSPRLYKDDLVHFNKRGESFYARRMSEELKGFCMAQANLVT